jgi:hypothetical protein
MWTSVSPCSEEAAARAYNKYLEDGIDPVEHRGRGLLSFTFQLNLSA